MNVKRRIRNKRIIYNLEFVEIENFDSTFGLSDIQLRKVQNNIGLKGLKFRKETLISEFSEFFAAFFLFIIFSIRFIYFFKLTTAFFGKLENGEREI